MINCTYFTVFSRLNPGKVGLIEQVTHIHPHSSPSGRVHMVKYLKGFGKPRITMQPGFQKSAVG